MHVCNAQDGQKGASDHETLEPNCSSAGARGVLAAEPQRPASTISLSTLSLPPLPSRQGLPM